MRNKSKKPIAKKQPLKNLEQQADELVNKVTGRLNQIKEATEPVQSEPAPPEPTEEDDAIINGEYRSIFLHDHEFDLLFKPHCRLIDRIYIGIERDKETGSDTGIFAEVYILNIEPKYPGIVNCYIRYENMVYQLDGIEEVQEYIDRFRKLNTWLNWQERQEKKIHKEVTGS